MKIKYREAYPERGVNGYLQTVINSNETINEYFGVKGSGHGYTSAEVNDFVKLHYGATWYYHENLGLAVDSEHDDLNIRLKKEDDTLVAPIEYMYPVLPVNTNSIGNPNFRGTWGTPIQSDSTLHDNTQSSGNTTVEKGVSPGDYQMQSGYTNKAKNGYSDVAKHEQKRVIRINI